MVDEAEKVLLASIPGGGLSINVLIPKKRGKGFLKVPIYHSVSPIDDVANAIGFDLYGLDGHVEVNTGSMWRPDRDVILTRVMTALSTYYKMPWLLIEDAEFWDKHPLTKHNI